MLYERLRREEFLRDYCKRGALILAEEGESVAAGPGEIDGTNKRDRYQNNQGGQNSEDDHNNLLKNQEREVQVERQRYAKGTSFVCNGLQCNECAKKSPNTDSCGQSLTTTEYWN